MPNFHYRQPVVYFSANGSIKPHSLPAEDPNSRRTAIVSATENFRLRLRVPLALVAKGFCFGPELSGLLRSLFNEQTAKLSLWRFGDAEESGRKV